MKEKSLRKGLKVGAMAIFLLLLVGVVFAGNTTIESKKTQRDKIYSDKMIKEMVKDLEQRCSVTDEDLKNEKLTPGDIQRVREFCALPTMEKEKILGKKLSKLKNKKSCDGEIVSRNNSYSCWTWYGGYNWGIPNYGDLGLSSSTCSWHDPNPSCKQEGGVACLWGCTNSDPNLGWHTKSFSSQTSLENEIYNKGYHRTAGYAAGQLQDYADADYTRGISYGYRYQVNWYETTRSAHSEGPEPNPESNWYGFIHDYWPEEVYDWHWNC